MLSRVSWLAVLLVAAFGCGPGYKAPGEWTPPGSLADQRPLAGRVDAVVNVPFDVLLPCVAGSPMGELDSASAKVVDPLGSPTMAMPSWRTEASDAFSCANSKWEGIAHVSVTFVPRAAGTWAATATLEPGVGTFSREIVVAP